MSLVSVITATSTTAILLACLLGAIAAYGCRQLRKTTLNGPCLWVVFSAAWLAASTFFDEDMSAIGRSALHFASAASTFCPLMAVLGAKRPQHRGWQWVVLTLWIVLIWPAIQAVLLPAGIRVELFVAWKLFLWGLIALGLLNYLPTIYWRSTILVALGQMLLLREHLWLPEAESTSINRLVASAAFLTAALLAWSTSHPLGKATTLNDRWLRFRNLFGAFWALRALGQINQAAELRGWPSRLEWSGFVPVDDNATNTVQSQEQQQTLESVLRRFEEPSESATLP